MRCVFGFHLFLCGVFQCFVVGVVFFGCFWEFYWFCGSVFLNTLYWLGVWFLVSLMGRIILGGISSFCG